MAATCSTSGVTGSSEPSLTDIMGVLMTIQNEQNTQKLNMKNIESNVLEMYIDCDDAEYDEQDEFFYDVDDNNNDVESRQEIDENVEMENDPPNKRRKTYDNSNETAPCQSSFIGAARSFKLRENVDKKVNDELADMINVIFREGISDEKYQDLLKTVLRPENCSSLTRTKVNQLIWNWLNPYTKSYDVSIQQHQNVIIKASIDVVKMLDKLDKMKINKKSSDSDIQECIDLGLGSIGLMAQYNRLINLKRKEVHRPDLEQYYHHLCSPNVERYTDLILNKIIITCVPLM